MRKPIYFFLTLIIFSFLFTTKVNAECSFKVRKELLNQAKNVDAYFEPDLNNNRFVFYLYNLTDDIYVEFINLSTNQSIDIYKYQFENNHYSMNIENTSENIKYRLYIKSNLSDCYSDTVTNKSLEKGIINKFYSDEVCKGIEDFMYCKPVINRKFSISDEKIYSKINEYKESLKVSEKKQITKENMFISFIKKYWKYILVIVVVITIVTIILINLNKKRGEL